MPFFFQLALVIAAITCFLVAVMWTANFATSDLRPRLAMASWIALGAFFSAFATLWFLVVYGSKAAGYELEPVDTGLVLVMAVCGLICFYRAGRAFVRACRFGTGRPLSPHDGAE
jgi:hypothetical protein